MKKTLRAPISDRCPCEKKRVFSDFWPLFEIFLPISDRIKKRKEKGRIFSSSDISPDSEGVRGKLVLFLSEKGPGRGKSIEIGETTVLSGHRSKIDARRKHVKKTCEKNVREKPSGFLEAETGFLRFRGSFRFRYFFLFGFFSEFRRKYRKKGPSPAVENRPLGPRSLFSFPQTTRRANLTFVPPKLYAIGSPPNGFAGALPSESFFLPSHLWLRFFAEP